MQGFQRLVRRGATANRALIKSDLSSGVSRARYFAAAQSQNEDATNADQAWIPPPLDRPRSLRDYEQLMDHLAKQQAKHLMRDVIEEMRLNGILPSQYMWQLGLAINAEEHSLEDTDFFLKEMQRHGHLPGFRSIQPVVETFARAGRVQEAARLAREVQAKGMKLPRNVYLALLNGYSMAGNLQAAQLVASQMRKRSVPLYQMGYASLIGCYARADKNCLPADFDEHIEKLMAEEEREAADAGHTEGRDRPLVLNAALDALAAQGRYSKAVELFEKARVSGVVPDAVTYSRALQCYVAKAIGKMEAWLTDAELENEVNKRLKNVDLEPYVHQILANDAASRWSNEGGESALDESDTSSSSSSSDSESDGSSSSSDSDSNEAGGEEYESNASNDGPSILGQDLALAMQQLHDRAVARARSSIKKQIMSERLDADAWVKTTQLDEEMTQKGVSGFDDWFRMIRTALDLRTLLSEADVDITPSPDAIASKALDKLQGGKLFLSTAAGSLLLVKAARRDAQDLDLAHRLFQHMHQSGRKPDADASWKYLSALLQRAPEESEAILTACQVILEWPPAVGVNRTKVLHVKQQYLLERNGTNSTDN